MSKKDIQGTQAYASVTAWLVPVAVAGLALVAVISYGRSEETQAASGAPLYGKAVHEAIEGLKNPGGKPVAAAARPALPAGLAPEDYYWCEQCKAYHKRQPAQGQPAGVVPPPVAGGDPGQAVGQGAEAIPPLPAGLSAADYYWCTNCKAYHKRQPAAGIPAAGTPAAPPVVPVNPVPPAAPVTPATPESNPIAKPLAPDSSVP